jgi:crotonobetainyl-CoA:carnitine CoA-transferase CaiB-like acyl-CoA transferase
MGSWAYWLLCVAGATARMASSASEWQAAFLAAGIPAGKVNTIPEAFEHPHVALRDTLVGFRNSTVGKRVKVAGNPIKLSQHKYEGFEPPPGFGEHSELVLKKLLNLSAQEWTSLREQKVTWWPTNGREYERPSIV